MLGSLEKLAQRQAKRYTAIKNMTKGAKGLTRRRSSVADNSDVPLLVLLPSSSSHTPERSGIVDITAIPEHALIGTIHDII